MLEIARSSSGEIRDQVCGGVAPTITVLALRPAIRDASSTYRFPVVVV
jgi:hypothetical protein